MKQKTTDRAIHALDAARRAGFAMYYKEADRCDELRTMIDELVNIILFHDRIPTGDAAITRAREISAASVD